VIFTAQNVFVFSGIGLSLLVLLFVDEIHLAKTDFDQRISQIPSLNRDYSPKKRFSVFSGIFVSFFAFVDEIHLQ
jgi:hypothetical protein